GGCPRAAAGPAPGIAQPLPERPNCSSRTDRRRQYSSSSISPEAKRWPSTVSGELSSRAAGRPGPRRPCPVRRNSARPPPMTRAQNRGKNRIHGPGPPSPKCARVCMVVQLLEERCPSCRSEEHTSELQSRENLVCRLLLEKK